MTTTSSLLLGNLKTSPIYIYTIDGNDCYSLQDMNQLFFDSKLNTKAVLIKQLFLSNPNHFIKDNHETIYMRTTTLMNVARLFNLYHLAELCKLTKTEILGGVADPLLNTITIEGWMKCVKFVVVERDHVYQSLNGDEWLFIAPPSAPVIEEVVKPVIEHPVLSSTQEMLCHWLSSNINTNSHNIIQTLISAAKVKKQQQAIIETRQRQIAFVIPMNNKSTNNSKKQHAPITTTSSYHQRKKNTAGIIHYKNDTNTPTPFPPSPPAVSHYTTTWRKRKTQHQLTTAKSKKTKSSLPLPPPPPPSRTTTTIYHGGNDNLHLLATQATQMRGLPLSPEVSPSPPPFYQQHRLPSIQVMLSELNHNHYHGHSS